MCAAASEVSVLANVQLGIVGTETEQEVAAGCSAVAVHLGTSPETVTVVEGASVNTATSVVSVVWQSEWKTGPCATFNVEVVGQETNTTRGVLSNSGGGTAVHLPFRAGCSVPASGAFLTCSRLHNQVFLALFPLPRLSTW